MSTITLDEQIASLQLFNEKTKELVELSFMQSLMSPNSGVTISGQLRDDGNYELRSEVRGPSKEATKAFVLTFRYFIQNNERISFENISNLYDTANVDSQLKNQFSSARKAVNDMLDAPNFMNLNYNSSVPTNREIMDVFIYGALAHANPQKYKLFREWMSFSPAAALFQSCFNIILGHVLEAIVYISQVNAKAIQQLISQKS
jgi:hypothetical protein